MNFSISSKHGTISVNDPDLTVDDYEEALDLLFPDRTVWDETADQAVMKDTEEAFNVGDRVKILSDDTYGLQGAEGIVESFEESDEEGLPGMYHVRVEVDAGEDPLYYFYARELSLLEAGEGPEAPEPAILEDGIGEGSWVKVVRSDCSDSGRVMGLTGLVMKLGDNEGTRRAHVDFMDDPEWTPDTTQGQCYFWVDVAALELVETSPTVH